MSTTAAAVWLLGLGLGVAAFALAIAYPHLTLATLIVTVVGVAYWQVRKERKGRSDG